MIVLFAALSPEIQWFLRRLAVVERLPVEGFMVTVGELNQRPLLICRTGIGRRAGEAAAAVLGRYRAEAALAVGLAGGLAPRCRVGDVVLCDRVQLSDASDGGGVIRCSQRLLELGQRAAQRQGLRSTVGGALTVPRPVTGREEKSRLRQTTELDLVEMESYWVGKEALEARVPFLAVRAISDGPEDPLLEVPGLVSPDGEAHLSRAFRHLLRRPGDAPLLLRTIASGWRAVRNLTRFLEGFVGAYGPSG